MARAENLIVGVGNWLRMVTMSLRSPKGQLKTYMTAMESGLDGEKASMLKAYGTISEGKIAEIVRKADVDDCLPMLRRSRESMHGYGFRRAVSDAHQDDDDPSLEVKIAMTHAIIKKMDPANIDHSRELMESIAGLFVGAKRYDVEELVIHFERHPNFKSDKPKPNNPDDLEAKLDWLLDGLKASVSSGYSRITYHGTGFTGVAKVANQSLSSIDNRQDSTYAKKGDVYERFELYIKRCTIAATNDQVAHNVDAYYHKRDNDGKSKAEVIVAGVDQAQYDMVQMVKLYQSADKMPSLVTVIHRIVNGVTDQRNVAMEMVAERITKRVLKKPEDVTVVIDACKKSPNLAKDICSGIGELDDNKRAFLGKLSAALSDESSVAEAATKAIDAKLEREKEVAKVVATKGRGGRRVSLTTDQVKEAADRAADKTR
jgi:hypothetical protein